MLDTRVLIEKLHAALVSQVAYSAKLKNMEFQGLHDDKDFILKETSEAHKLFLEWRALVSKIEPRPQLNVDSAKSRISRVQGRIIQG